VAGFDRAEAVAKYWTNQTICLDADAEFREYHTLLHRINKDA